LNNCLVEIVKDFGPFGLLLYTRLKKNSLIESQVPSFFRCDSLLFLKQVIDFYGHNVERYYKKDKSAMKNLQLLVKVIPELEELKENLKNSSSKDKVHFMN
jgi:hypothetical protein